MKNKTFLLQFNKEGQIDLRALEQKLNLPIMLVWLLDRIRGFDAFAPAPDLQNLEGPTAIFLDLWRRSKKHVRIRLLLDQAIAMALECRLLRDLNQERVLLDLVGSMNPANNTRHLLLTVVSEVASGRSRFSPEDMAAKHDDEWLFTATCLGGHQPFQEWKKLFRTKRYMETAFYGLRNDVEVGLYYLPEYWRRAKIDTKSEEAADDMLHEQIADISGMFPYSSLEFHLKRHEKRIRRIDQKLPEKIDKALQSFSKKPVFTKK